MSMSPLVLVFLILGVAAVILFRAANLHTRSTELADSAMKADTAAGPSENEGRLALWLSRAGYRKPSAPLLFLGAGAAATALGSALSFAAVRLGIVARMTESVSAIPGGIGDALGAVLARAPYIIFVLFASAPALVVRATRRRRIMAIEEDLAPALELLATLAEAGLGFDAALARIQESETTGRPLTVEFRIHQHDVLGGIGRIQSLRDLSRRIDLPSVSIFISAMIQAEQAGASLADTLRAQADDLRDRRKMQALLQAQALPVKLVFPLMVCFLPGIFFSTLGPVLNQFIEVVDSVLRKP